MKKKFTYTGLVVLSTIVLVYGCSKGYDMTATPGNNMAANIINGDMAQVVIQNMTLMPDTLSIKMGTTVTWSNMDMVMHDVTELNGMFYSNNIAPGESYSYTFAGAGTFTYRSMYYPSMKNGVVIVSY